MGLSCLTTREAIHTTRHVQRAEWNGSTNGQPHALPLRARRPSLVHSLLSWGGLGGAHKLCFPRCVAALVFTAVVPLTGLGLFEPGKLRCVASFRCPNHR